MAGDEEFASLDALARAKGVRFGAAVGARGMADPAFMALIAAQCGVVVAENQHKWLQTHPAPGEYTFAQGDALVDWADANAIITRGHNLVWHYPRWIPDWVSQYDFGANPRAEAERLLTEHISTVSAHYAGRIHSWDVINETIDPSTGELRDTVFTEAIGSRDQPLKLMFEVARAALPDAQLVYNDFMTWDARSAAHRTRTLRLLEWFRANEVPVDALGIQAHLSVRSADHADPERAPQEREWRQFLDEVTGMGYQLLITELDVNDVDFTGAIPARDQAVADCTRAYLDLMLSYPQLEQVLTWGITDHYSWLQNLRARADEEPLRPLLYDADYRPKLVREAVAAAFRSAPAR
jgi:endo-1,4-beta-xylanase